jgi:predicted HAD superfamily Cof-like phosphohydrolase
MQDKLKKLIEFHTTYECVWNDEITPVVDEKLVRLRHRLMQEENKEYLEAALSGDKIEIADALGDELYILLGTIITHGLQHKIEEVFDEIHRSNMSKLDENGKPIFREDRKVLKGKNYFKPNIKEIIES